MKEIKLYLENNQIKAHLDKILGENSQSLVTSALQVVSNNSLLQKASPQSIYGAVVTSAVLKLPINQNLGYAYIVPYKGQAQFQIGWKGLVQLAIRSGKFETINSVEIYENQIKEVDIITGEPVIVNEKPKGKIVGYLAFFRLLSGYKKYFYMTKEECEKHAKKYSKSYKKGFGVWADGEDGFNSMAKKTVLKLLLNQYAPLSISMEEAIIKDQAILDEKGEVKNYVDNEKNIINNDDFKKAKENLKMGNFIKKQITDEEIPVINLEDYDESEN